LRAAVPPASRFSAQQIAFDAKRRPFHRLCPPFHRFSPDLLKDPAHSRALSFGEGLPAVTLGKPFDLNAEF